MIVRPVRRIPQAMARRPPRPLNPPPPPVASTRHAGARAGVGVTSQRGLCRRARNAPPRRRRKRPAPRLDRSRSRPCNPQQRSPPPEPRRPTRRLISKRSRARRRRVPAASNKSVRARMTTSADRRLATRGERDLGAARGDRNSSERNSTRDAATQSSRFSGTRAPEPDDEAAPRTRTIVVGPARSQTDVSSEDVVTTRKQRRSARSRPDLEPRVEEREILRRDTSGDGGRDFFGGLFGGERD